MKSQIALEVTAVCIGDNRYNLIANTDCVLKTGMIIQIDAENLELGIAFSREDVSVYPCRYLKSYTTNNLNGSVLFSLKRVESGELLIKKGDRIAQVSIKLK